MKLLNNYTKVIVVTQLMNKELKRLNDYFPSDLLHVIKSMSMKVRTEDSMGWCWRCTMCDYFSANQTNLTNHIEKNHLDQCYFCPKCSKEFRSRHALKIHIQRLHDDEPQCCVICAKMFPSRKTLKAHVKSHSMQPVIGESHSIMQQVLMPQSPYLRL